jgi:cell division protein FtsQ
VRPVGVYRRRRAVAGVVLLVLLAGLGVGAWALLYVSPLLRVERVTVAGETTVPAATVLAAAAVPAGEPLASVDTQAVADRVAALPAVRSAHVALAWPHTVAVQVQERTAVATVTTDAGLQLVDAGGAVFTGPTPPGLPALTMTSVAPGDPATTAALTALAALPAPVRAQVRTLAADVSGPGAAGRVTFGLTGNRRVDWGSVDRSAQKAAVLVPLLTQPGHVFDVSSPDLPTIRR